MGPSGQDRRHSSPPEGLVSQIGWMIIIVIKGQVPTLVFHKNKLFISFRLIEFVFPPFFGVKKGLTCSDPSVR